MKNTKQQNTVQPTNNYSNEFKKRIEDLINKKNFNPITPNLPTDNKIDPKIKIFFDKNTTQNQQINDFLVLYQKLLCALFFMNNHFTYNRYIKYCSYNPSRPDIYCRY